MIDRILLPRFDRRYAAQLVLGRHWRDANDEQRKRFLARIDEPDKNWKFSLADVRERKHWKKYMEAYEACLAATSTEHAPWYVVPADDKKNARLIVSHIILETMKGLGISYPKVSQARRKELQAIRKSL